jgi:DNA-binding response OmpR family regulator
MYTILVCDDDKEIVDAIEIYLTGEGYQVKKAYNGIEAINCVSVETIHLVLLDIMMPELNGIRTTMKLREMNQTVPIIFLSAKSEDNDKILGLNIGADDYITKPFNPLELLARVKSSLRRYTQLGNMKQVDNLYSSGGLIIDDERKEVKIDGELVKLTPIEYNLLKLLVKNKGKIFSISEIYELIWNEPSFGVDNIVAVHIRHIREKIEINPKDPKYLKVAWGIGYKIEKYD